MVRFLLSVCYIFCSSACKQYLVVSAVLRHVAVSIRLSINRIAWNSSTPTGQIFVTLFTGFLNLLIHLKFD